MKRQLIERSQKSLIVCDNTKCNYEIPYSIEEEKNIVSYINKSCPQCGENLLTKEDYIQYYKILKVVNWLNKWFSWTMYFVSKKSWENRQTFKVHTYKGIKIEEE